jgi:hypothetical protein
MLPTPQTALKSYTGGCRDANDTASYQLEMISSRANKAEAERSGCHKWATGTAEDEAPHTRCAAAIAFDGNARVTKIGRNEVGALLATNYYALVGPEYVSNRVQMVCSWTYKGASHP